MHDSASIASDRALRIQSCEDAGYDFKWKKVYHLMMLTKHDDEGELVMAMPILFCWN